MLISLTIAVMSLSKLPGIVIAIILRRTASSLVWGITKGGLAEIVVTIVIAPVITAFQANFVVSVWPGIGVKWETQERKGRFKPFEFDRVPFPRDWSRLL